MTWGFVATGVVGVHEVMRAAGVVLEVVQLVGHGKVFEASGNGMVRVGDGDGEIHVRAVAVEKAIEHLVVAGVVAEGSVCGVQAEEAAAAFDKVQKPCSCAWVKCPTSVKKRVASYAARPLAMTS